MGLFLFEERLEEEAKERVRVREGDLPQLLCFDEDFVSVFSIIVGRYFESGKKTKSDFVRYEKIFHFAHCLAI